MHAATVLRDARRRAGLTQARLAERAGLTQSVISAYESGHRQPSLPTLTALVEATGVELHLEVRAIPRRLDGLTGPVGRNVRCNRRQLVEAAARHDVHGLRVFGSVARGEDTGSSDLDLLADLPAGMTLVGLGRVRDDLEQIAGCPVDLVPATDLKPDVRSRVLREAIVL